VTPEGKVKAKVRELLGTYGDELYSYWPVPTGFGRTTVDAIGCYRGQFFAVETKAEKKKPTLRQVGELHRMECAMARTFVIAGETSPVLQELRHWLDYLKATVPHDPSLTPDQTNRRPI
jgi:hypothetical protein